MRAPTTPATTSHQPPSATDAVAAQQLVSPFRAGNARFGQVFRVLAELALLAGLTVAVLIALGVVGTPWYRILSVDGGSMAPTIAGGDLVVVAPPPAHVRPGMIIVMLVGSEVVTHRVVAVSPDGVPTTKGDANRVIDDWGGEPVTVVGRYVATIPWLGAILPIPDVSAALFTDRISATMNLRVGIFPIPPIAATVRVAPKTIDLRAAGTITAFVDSLAGPHRPREIDLSSVQLCYQGQCTASVGPAKLDGEGHVAASFDRVAFAGIVGTDRGSLGLVVQGRLVDGNAFRGTSTNRVNANGGARNAAGGAAPAGTASAGTGVASPSPTATPTGSAQPSPSAGASGAPAAFPSPTDLPSPSVDPSPSPNPSASPTPGPSPSPALSPSPSSSPSPSPSPTPSPSPSPTSTPTPHPTHSPHPSPSPTTTPSPTPSPSPSPGP